MYILSKKSMVAASDKTYGESLHIMAKITGTRCIWWLLYFLIDYEKTLDWQGMGYCYIKSTNINWIINVNLNRSL